ncbi:MAG: hypothetical protein JRG97_15740 [Deltaproteobacteria bacterium]|nr:hypothetical protein [Deltaproteobacteria bacterium]MBW2053818.1 hypothetical protein [Deltaproteobacteria bacterium]MBW2142484.1 hypothetical protein [Deltaproteobacteria bacterium]
MKIFKTKKGSALLHPPVSVRRFQPHDSEPDIKRRQALTPQRRSRFSMPRKPSKFSRALMTRGHFINCFV